MPLRFLLAARPQAVTAVLAVVQRAISTFVIQQSGFTVASGARTGAVTLIQRFGSALNLNVHLHMLFLDGAYCFRGNRTTFHRARRPTGEELNRLLDALSRRIVCVLERRGLLIADPEYPYLDLEPGSSLDHLQAASIAYRIAIGPNAGRKALVLYRLPRLEETPERALLAKVAGFSLHAATVCEAWQQSRLERLCRYVTRPPIATKRLSVDDRGRVVYQYKHPFRDGSTHVVLEPLDFMYRMCGMPRAQGCAGAAIARLAALVPRPRLNLTRFHGIFAPNFKHRNRIVPHRTRGKIDADRPTAPMSWPLPRILALRGTGTPVQWMQRLKRVFAIDIETCPECGGKLRVIACIEDPPLIRRILGHMQRRETFIGSIPRAPPDSQQVLNLT